MGGAGSPTWAPGSVLLDRRLRDGRHRLFDDVRHRESFVGSFVGSAGVGCRIDFVRCSHSRDRHQPSSRNVRLRIPGCRKFHEYRLLTTVVRLPKRFCVGSCLIDAVSGIRWWDGEVDASRWWDGEVAGYGRRNDNDRRFWLFCCRADSGFQHCECFS